MSEITLRIWHPTDPLVAALGIAGSWTSSLPRRRAPRDRRRHRRRAHEDHHAHGAPSCATCAASASSVEVGTLLGRDRTTVLAALAKTSAPSIRRREELRGVI